MDNMKIKILAVILVSLFFADVAYANPGWSDPYIAYAGCSKIVVEWEDNPTPDLLPEDLKGYIKMAGEDTTRDLVFAGNYALETYGGFPFGSEQTIEWGIVLTKNEGWLGIVNTPYTFTCVPEFTYIPMVMR